jgi:alpha-1,6-mannosyltransferase
MRIVRLANFVTPVSGGVRTALAHLAQEYRARDIEPVLVVPGPSDARYDGPDGTVVTLASPRLPGTTYHVLLDRARVKRALRALRPDAVEVHDRFTLAWTVPWLRRHRVPTVLMVHERLRTPLRAFAHLPDTAADLTEAAANLRLVESVGPVVVASRSVARTFPADGTTVVPLGVDRATFPPRSIRGEDRQLRLVLVGRLSAEKAPLLAVDTATMLAARGHDVHLHVVGTGPLAKRVARRAAWSRTTLHGHVPQTQVGRIVRRADVLLAPCPTEAFGLAALEALASGVPVVAHREGAVSELLGFDDPAPVSTVPAPTSHIAPRRRPPQVDAAGAVGDGFACDLVTAVEALLEVPDARRREAAIGRAARYPWSASADGLLRAVGMPSAAVTVRTAVLDGQDALPQDAAVPSSAAAGAEAARPPQPVEVPAVTR